jgi:hypothetical protein
VPRLALTYALIDGKDFIDIGHLDAAPAEQRVGKPRPGRLRVLERREGVRGLAVAQDREAVPAAQ